MHEGSNKGEHPLLHDNLNKDWKEDWHERRECFCKDYQVCTATNCTKGHHAFEAIAPIPHFARNIPHHLVSLIDCILLPYTPTLAPAGSNIPFTATPQVQCTVEGTNFTVNATIVETYPLLVGPTDHYPVNCTYNLTQFIVIDDVTFFIFKCHAVHNFHACSQIVLPLDFATDIFNRENTCSHHHDHEGSPKDGAGKITGWVTVGLTGFAIIFVIIFFSVRRGRRATNGKSKRQQEREEELTPLRGYNPRE